MLHVIILLQYATYANKPIETNSGPNPKPLKGKNLPRNAFSFSQVSFCNQSIGEPLNLEECHSPGMHTGETYHSLHTRDVSTITVQGCTLEKIPILYTLIHYSSGMHTTSATAKCSPKKCKKRVPENKYPPSQSRDAHKCKCQMGDFTFSLLPLYSKFKSYFEEKEKTKR